MHTVEVQGYTNHHQPSLGPSGRLLPESCTGPVLWAAHTMLLLTPVRGLLHQ
jgi:hypothetical protein